MPIDIKVTILDGYTDEPSCLGVPPFIAPLPRYIFGAIKDASKHSDINYVTIDEYRLGLLGKDRRHIEKLKKLNQSNLLIVIAGAIVPGKYLRGNPISLRETIECTSQFKGIKLYGGACTRFGFGDRAKINSVATLKNSFDFVCPQDLDAAVYDYLTDNEPHERFRTGQEARVWSKLGSAVVEQHPDFPNPLIVELEGGRGCVRYHAGGCSFCSETQFGKPQFRPPDDIINEAKCLNSLGVTNFRLGGLSDIFSYFAKGIGETETPKPNPNMVGKLLNGILGAAPNINVLHLDNANPAVMAANISETKAILRTIIGTCTGGNVLSFGLESADPKVITDNNLNTNPLEVEEMVKLVNQYGAAISNTGLPKLLPGLNFVYGLRGESKNTFRLNFEFLKSIYDQGLLVRRINLRQVIEPPGGAKSKYNVNKYHKEFHRHKKMVREYIDKPMLERLLPENSVLKNVFTEQYKGNITFGRQIGTYPILVGIPYKVPLSIFNNVVITEHGFRSVTGFSSPFNINTASGRAFQAIPGIGRKRAIRLIKARPFREISEFWDALDDKTLISNFQEHLSFEIP